MNIEEEPIIHEMCKDIKTISEQISHNRDRIVALELDIKRISEKEIANSNVIYGLILGLFILVIIL